MRVRGWYLPACITCDGQGGGLPAPARPVYPGVAAEQGVQAAAQALQFFRCHCFGLLLDAVRYMGLMRSTISAPKAMYACAPLDDGSNTTPGMP